mmetsp:Transcript_33243/g.105992  ORF Transcript_33243/g.105992 Transcript_33243/m.105992 type:complete len:287 (-) Transcript_33243:664-1524(-)
MGEENEARQHFHQPEGVARGPFFEHPDERADPQEPLAGRQPPVRVPQVRAPNIEEPVDRKACHQVPSEPGAQIHLREHDFVFNDDAAHVSVCVEYDDHIKEEYHIKKQLGRSEEAFLAITHMIRLHRQKGRGEGHNDEVVCDAEEEEARPCAHDLAPRVKARGELIPLNNVRQIASPFIFVIVIQPLRNPIITEGSHPLVPLKTHWLPSPPLLQIYDIIAGLHLRPTAGALRHEHILRPLPPERMPLGVGVECMLAVECMPPEWEAQGVGVECFLGVGVANPEGLT